MKKTFLKNWELALLMAMCLSTLAGAWAEKRAASLSSDLVRLHVIAVSDEEYEQELKLRVRDGVLRCLEPKLETARDAKEAQEIIAASLGDIELAAAELAEGRAVSVTLGRERYPTRYYDTFALPAGEYTSLRVTLGEGKGRNWWCVVFPPLCLTAAEGEDALSALSEEDRAIIAEDGGVELRFKLVELWGELKAALGV